MRTKVPVPRNGTFVFSGVPPRYPSRIKSVEIIFHATIIAKTMSRTTAARASLFGVAGMVSERLRMFLKGIRAPTPTPRMEPASSARYRG